MSDAQAIIDYVSGVGASTPVELTPGKRVAFVLPGVGDNPARVEVIETYADDTAPRRAIGNLRVNSASGFVAAVNSRIDPKKAPWNLYADVERMALVAVLNDDVVVGAGWRDHRVTLVLRATPEWTHWKGHQGLVDQQAFAAAIEAGIDEISDPPASQMLEVAQRFDASVNARFKTVNRLRDGARQLVYEEEVDATAGDVTIPEEFIISVAPYFGSDPQVVTARLKFRIANGKLSIGYALVKPEAVERRAFSEVVASVSADLNRPAIEGEAPAS